MIGLDLITPATIPVVSTADAKTYLRVDHTDEDDLIDDLVAAATRQLEERTRRAFISQTWQVRAASLTQTNEYGRPGVELPRPPLIGVTAVKYWPDVSGTVLRGRGARIVVGSSTATLDRVLTGASTVAVTDAKGLVFEDLALTVDSVGTASSILSGSLPTAGTYYVDYYADSTTVWSTFLAWDVEQFDTPARIVARSDDLPDVDTDNGSPWLVRYVAGYGAASVDVPSNVVNAIKLLLGHLYENRGEAAVDAKIPSSVIALIEPETIPNRF